MNNLIYERYYNSVNMDYGELLEWSKNPCSKEASLDRSPIKRNLHLLSTLKEEWKDKEMSWAKRTISFIARNKGQPSGRPVCNRLSKRTIALKNWAYDPNKE